MKFSEIGAKVKSGEITLDSCGHEIWHDKFVKGYDYLNCVRTTMKTLFDNEIENTVQVSSCAGVIYYQYFPLRWTNQFNEEKSVALSIVNTHEDWDQNTHSREDDGLVRIDVPKYYSGKLGFTADELRKIAKGLEKMAVLADNLPKSYRSSVCRDSDFDFDSIPKEIR